MGLTCPGQDAAAAQALLVVAVATMGAACERSRASTGGTTDAPDAASTVGDGAGGGGTGHAAAPGTDTAVVPDAESTEPVTDTAQPGTDTGIPVGGEDVAAPEDGGGVDVGNPVPDDGSCIVVDGDATTTGIPAALAARITAVSGDLMLFHGADNGLDFAALASVGALLPDYQNGVLFPEVQGIFFEYLSFPALASVGTGQILLHGGRVAFPRLVGGRLFTVGSVDTFELAPAAKLESFADLGSERSVAPRPSLWTVWWTSPPSPPWGRPSASTGGSARV